MNKTWILVLVMFFFVTSTHAIIWQSGNANVARIYSIEYSANSDIGSVITLNGTGFVPSIRVLLGGVSAPTWNVLSSTQMTAVIPTPSILGVITRDITLLSQADNKTSNLLYKMPVITGVSPATGACFGGTIITISGSGFASNASVLVSGNPATSVQYIDNTQLAATIPASIPANTGGNAPITVINPSGISGQVTGLFAYLPPFSATGGTVTEIVEYRFHTFTASGTFTVNRAGNVEVLVLAGGGSGGVAHGGGGGAGGLVYNNYYSISSGGYTVVVGEGGSTKVSRGGGNSGQNSVFGSLTAIGGGGGGSEAGPISGTSGGSGGGGARTTSGTGSGGSGTAGQGNNGGTGNGDAWTGAGGGGAGAVGSNGTAGSGGAGLTYNISGTSVCYAGGGGGAPNSGSSSAGCGGSAGIGDNSSSAAATPHTGAGSGGTRDYSGGSGCVSGAGGSGIVIIRYLINQ